MSEAKKKKFVNDCYFHDSINPLPVDLRLLILDFHHWDANIEENCVFYPSIERDGKVSMRFSRQRNQIGMAEEIIKPRKYFQKLYGYFTCDNNKNFYNNNNTQNTTKTTTRIRKVRRIFLIIRYRIKYEFFQNFVSSQIDLYSILPKSLRFPVLEFIETGIPNNHPDFSDDENDDDNDDEEENNNSIFPPPLAGFQRIFESLGNLSTNQPNQQNQEEEDNFGPFTFNRKSVLKITSLTHLKCINLNQKIIDSLLISNNRLVLIDLKTRTFNFQVSFKNVSSFKFIRHLIIRNDLDFCCFIKNNNNNSDADEEEELDDLKNSFFLNLFDFRNGGRCKTFRILGSFEFPNFFLINPQQQQQQLEKQKHHIFFENLNDLSMKKAHPSTSSPKQQQHLDDVVMNHNFFPNLKRLCIDGYPIAEMISFLGKLLLLGKNNEKFKKLELFYIHEEEICLVDSKLKLFESMHTNDDDDMKIPMKGFHYIICHDNPYWLQGWMRAISTKHLKKLSLVTKRRYNDEFYGQQQQQQQQQPQAGNNGRHNLYNALEKLASMNWKMKNLAQIDENSKIIQNCFMGSSDNNVLFTNLSSLILVLPSSVLPVQTCSNFTGLDTLSLTCINFTEVFEVMVKSNRRLSDFTTFNWFYPKHCHILQKCANLSFLKRITLYTSTCHVLEFLKYNLHISEVHRPGVPPIDYYFRDVTLRSMKPLKVPQIIEDDDSDEQHYQLTLRPRGALSRSIEKWKFFEPHFRLSEREWLAYETERLKVEMTPFTYENRNACLPAGEGREGRDGPEKVRAKLKEFLWRRFSKVSGKPSDLEQEAYRAILNSVYFHKFGRGYFDRENFVASRIYSIVGNGRFLSCYYYYFARTSENNENEVVHSSCLLFTYNGDKLQRKLWWTENVSDEDGKNYVVKDIAHSKMFMEIKSCLFGGLQLFDHLTPQDILLFVQIASGAFLVESLEALEWTVQQLNRSGEYTLDENEDLYGFDPKEIEENEKLEKKEEHEELEKLEKLEKKKKMKDEDHEDEDEDHEGNRSVIDRLWSILNLDQRLDGEGREFRLYQYKGLVNVKNYVVKLFHAWRFYDVE